VVEQPTKSIHFLFISNTSLPSTRFSSGSVLSAYDNLKMKLILLFASVALAAAVPRVVQVHPSDIKVRNVGGSSFKLTQVHNDMYRQHGKGPRALAKVYQKYGLEMPATLRAVVSQILLEMGVELPHKLHDGPHHHIGGAPYTNETDDEGQWMRCFRFLL
jgi:hypothetical protein